MCFFVSFGLGFVYLSRTPAAIGRTISKLVTPAPASAAKTQRAYNVRAISSSPGERERVAPPNTNHRRRRAAPKTPNPRQGGQHTADPNHKLKREALTSNLN